MAEFTLTLPDTLSQELHTRAEKREISVEEYIIKSLRWHIKQVKKIEAGLEDDAQTFSLLAQAVVSTVPDSEDAEK